MATQLDLVNDLYKDYRTKQQELDAFEVSRIDAVGAMDRLKSALASAQSAGDADGANKIQWAIDNQNGPELKALLAKMALYQGPTGYIQKALDAWTDAKRNLSATEQASADAVAKASAEAAVASSTAATKASAPNYAANTTKYYIIAAVVLIVVIVVYFKFRKKA